MQTEPLYRRLPTHIWILIVVLYCSSLMHFTYSSKYIAFKSGVPEWASTLSAYLTWFLMTGVGIVGVVLEAFGRRKAGSTVLALYGILGLLSLRYYLPPMNFAYSFAMNFTIILQASTGTLLTLTAGGNLRYLGKAGAGRLTGHESRRGQVELGDEVKAPKQAA